MGYFLRCDAALEISVADFISARYVRKGDGEIPFAVVGEVRFTAFFSAGLIVCATSLFLNVRLAERMGQLQDNDMKYRYLLMQGQADGNTLERLENKFKWQRDERFIRNLTDSVLDFEERCRRQAEALERARLLNEQAEQLKKEADRLGNQ